ncbi:MAG: polyphosphate polymerase domain-containing protein [Prolixibacteraceae bacterium]|jgi:hypothetical protein
MKEIINSLNDFSTVNLSDLDKVKLMNRTDQKFCLHIDKIPVILEKIKDHYSILEIDGKSVFQYDNTYYDTPDDQMYLNHHNGKRNRFKIRVRQYTQTNINFLEIKFKSNKGRTIKERITRPDFELNFTEAEKDFIGNSSPFSGSMLEPKMRNTFNRITLVNKQFTERVTIDFASEFKNHEKEITLDSLVIVEVKQNRSSDYALFARTLKELKVENQGFSKYCIGRSLLEEKIKKNNFKPILMKIRKQYLN